MKELFEKVFNKKTATPIFVGFGTFAIFNFIVFPGLTTANTFFNIVSAIIAAFTLLFVFYYLDFDRFFKEEVKEVPPGETELDFIPPEELKPKKKKAVKKENPIVKVNKTK